MLVFKSDLQWMGMHAERNTDDLYEKPVCRAHGITLCYEFHTHDVYESSPHQGPRTMQSITHIFCVHCMPERKSFAGGGPGISMTELVKVDTDLNPIDTHPHKQKEVEVFRRLTICPRPAP